MEWLKRCASSWELEVLKAQGRVGRSGLVAMPQSLRFTAGLGKALYRRPCGRQRDRTPQAAQMDAEMISSTVISSIRKAGRSRVL